ncbi:reverse transcriptase domain-containing protein [Tanacetum coccineum]
MERRLRNSWSISKVETGRMKEAPECMKISGFMHGVNNPELTKHLNEHVPKTLEEKMIMTTAFIRRETTAATPKEIFAAESEKFKPPPPMVTLADKRSSNKFCEFHNDKGHNMDECMQLKKQIKELPRHRVTRQKATLSFAQVNEITFPPLSANKGTEGPLVIEAEIGGHAIHRMYVDGGSSMEVLYEHCFNRLWLEIKSQMVPATTSLTGFSGETIWPLGQLRLLVTIGDAEHFTKACMNFMIVRSPSSYNDIIRRPGIREIQAVPSTAHEMLKFPVDGGVVTIRSIILTLNECATITATSKDSTKKIEGGQKNLKVAIHHDFSDQEVALGGTLSIEGRTALCALLKRNQDIFAWQPSDMTGTEVQKLVKAGIMREVYYHDWLSNPVMVKKHDGSWRMCVDFTNLNKACLQDCYPLPEIDWKVESLFDYPFKCFLDAYKGYHQIQMAELDEEKTAFHTPHGVYCYTKMSFGLKNAGATYQWLVDKAFEKQVGQNLEVYVDDLFIKSHTEAELLRDIEETFRTLRKINMKLNPKKCTFRAVEGMFLGYMIGLEGIKPCPEKIEAVLQLPSPRTIKEVQSLNGKLAGLNRTPHVGGTKAKGRANNVLIRLLMSGWRCLDDRKGLNPDTSLFFITDQPIKQVMSHPDVAGRLQKWSIMLGEHNITYKPRTSVKGQILADFFVEKPEEALADMSEKEAPPNGAEFTYALRFQFTASNNEAEYEALLVGLRIAAQMGVRNVRVSVDSKLMENQVLGTYIPKEENMMKYLEKVKSLVSGFASFSISHVLRSHNKKADALSKIASTSFAHLSKQVLVEVLQEKSIQEQEVAAVVEEEGPTWMTPITEYLKDGVLPDDKKEANKLRIKARQYELMDGILYRRSFLRSWLRQEGNALFGFQDLCLRQELLEYMDVHDNDASESSQPSWGKMEVNPVHAYYNGSCISKDNEDPSWSTSFKTRRTQKTSSALEDFTCVVFVHDRNILMGIGIPQEDVLSAAESIGCSIFNVPFNVLGVKVGDNMLRRSAWEDIIEAIINWLEKYSGFKKNRGLGVSSFFALNRALLFKWIWRFISQDSSLWARFIKAIYGTKAALDNSSTLLSRCSPWLNILREFRRLSLKVATKLKDSSLCLSFRRAPRSGIEADQFCLLSDSVAHIILPQINDRWVWNLESSGEFSVKSARSFIDDSLLPKLDAPTRWVKVVPIKINIFSWRVCLDKLPSRLSISLRGLDIPSILCPICSIAVESSSHLLFSCHLAWSLMLKVARWCS